MDRPSAPSGSATTPDRIHADRAARTLSIVWRDGHQTLYDFEALRWLCPCAFCRGEAGMPGWLDSRPTLTPQQTTMSDIRMVGQYAVQPVWADGHDSGFYAFLSLRQHCPCPECTVRRAAADGPGRASGHLAGY